jgi:hypothetical protein
MQVLTKLFNLYNPLVYGVADIIDTYVYRAGLMEMNFSYSTAIGLFKNLAGLILRKKRYNINIKHVPVDLTNAGQRNLLRATGVDFDFWTWATLSPRQAVENGLVRSLSEDMVRKYAPGVVEILESKSPHWPYRGIR